MVVWELKSPAYRPIQGGARAGIKLPTGCSFVFACLYSLTTVVPSIFIAVHSISLTVFDELIGVHLAEFFTNVSVLWLLLLVQAARL